MRDKRIKRVFIAVREFSKPQGTTIKDLMEALETKDRSVAYRMIRTLEELGFPVYDEKLPMDREKRWKFQDDFLLKLPNLFLPSVQLNFSEALALYLVKGECSVYRGTAIQEELNSAFESISNLLPGEMANKFDKASKLYVQANKFAKDYEGKEDIIESLALAMLEQNTLRVNYDSFLKGEVRSFRINPLNFFDHKGGLYVFVQVTRFGDIRSLAVDRIQSLEDTEETFEYPCDFDPEKRLSEAFGVVHDDPIQARIWFSASQAPYIKEKQLRYGEEIKENSDGSVEVFLNTSGRWDVKQWILSWGMHAKVLEPSDLKEEVAADLRNALAHYE